MRSFTAFILLALVVAVAVGHASASDVVDLNADNFAEKVGDTSRAWFVEFYAPWCGHCKRLAPVWEELATSLNGQVHVAKVDATQSRQLAQSYGVRGYPTVLLFTGGPKSEPVKYSGARTVQAFTDWLDHKEALAPPKIVLRYFPTRGRAELIRLVLEEAGLSYEQDLHSADWPEFKKKGIATGILPFGQMPALSWGDRHLVQSMAIVRFIGRKKGLYPSDVEAATEVDVVLETYGDVRGRYGKLVYNPDYDKLKDEYFSKTLPLWLGHLERYLGDKKFFAANQLTVADLAIFDVLTVNLRLEPTVLANFPNLQRFHQSIGARPKIAAYLASDRRPKYQNGLSAHFDNKEKPGHRVF